MIDINSMLHSAYTVNMQKTLLYVHLTYKFKSYFMAR